MDIQVGIDFGNWEVKCVARTARTVVAKSKFKAFTGALNSDDLTTTGEVYRETLLSPKHANIGETATRLSDFTNHVISPERYFSVGGNETRPLSQAYFLPLIDFAIGQAISKLAAKLDTVIVLANVTLVIALPERHVTPMMVKSLVDGLKNDRIIQIFGGPKVEVSITNVDIKSQLYCAMLGQYMWIDYAGVINKDVSWETEPKGVWDIGSHTMQLAIFSAMPDVYGKMAIAAGKNIMCTEDGMLSCAAPLAKRIAESEVGELYRTLTDTQLMTILETGNLDGIDFTSIQQGVLQEKAIQLVGQSRKLFESGQKTRAIVLVGQSNYVLAAHLRAAYAGAMEKLKMQMKLAVEHQYDAAAGQMIEVPDLAFAIANGAANLAFIRSSL